MCNIPYTFISLKYYLTCSGGYQLVHAEMLKCQKLTIQSFYKCQFQFFFPGLRHPAAKLAAAAADCCFTLFLFSSLGSCKIFLNYPLECRQIKFLESFWIIKIGQAIDKFGCPILHVS